VTCDSNIVMLLKDKKLLLLNHIETPHNRLHTSSSATNCHTNRSTVPVGTYSQKWFHICHIVQYFQVQGSILLKKKPEHQFA